MASLTSKQDDSDIDAAAEPVVLRPRRNAQRPQLTAPVLATHRGSLIEDMMRQRRDNANAGYQPKGLNIRPLTTARPTPAGPIADMPTIGSTKPLPRSLTAANDMQDSDAKRRSSCYQSILAPGGQPFTSGSALLRDRPTGYGLSAASMQQRRSSISGYPVRPSSARPAASGGDIAALLASRNRPAAEATLASKNVKAGGKTGEGQRQASNDDRSRQQQLESTTGRVECTTESHRDIPTFAVAITDDDGDDKKEKEEEDEQEQDKNQQKENSTSAKCNNSHPTDVQLKTVTIADNINTDDSNDERSNGLGGGGEDCLANDDFIVSAQHVHRVECAPPTRHVEVPVVDSTPTRDEPVTTAADEQNGDRHFAHQERQKKDDDDDENKPEMDTSEESDDGDDETTPRRDDIADENNRHSVSAATDDVTSSPLPVATTVIPSSRRSPWQHDVIATTTTTIEDRKSPEVPDATTTPERLVFVARNDEQVVTNGSHDDRSVTSSESDEASVCSSRAQSAVVNGNEEQSTAAADVVPTSRTSNGCDAASERQSPTRTCNGLEQVVINKGNLGLGFCLGGGKGSSTGDQPIFIKRVFKGDATIQQCLSAGDEIHSINGIDVSSMTHFEAWNHLKALPDGPLRLTVRHQTQR